MSDSDGNIGRMIQEAWKRAGVDADMPGLSMPQLLELSDENLRQSVPTALNNWLLVFDECGAWISNLAALLMFSLKLNSSGDVRLRRVLACIVGNISAQVMAIRKLVLSGLDVQAKQLLRVLVENIDVALLIARNESALNAFELTLDGPSSNDFWHKWISKGKVRAIIHSDLSKFISADSYREFAEYIKQEEQILGMAVHPSLAAAQMACLPRIINGKETEPFTFGFLGGVSSFSERTLSYGIYYLALFIFDVYVPKSIRAHGYDNVVQKGVDELHDRISRGRIALGEILSYTFQRTRSAEFSTSGVMPGWEQSDIDRGRPIP